MNLRIIVLISLLLSISSTSLNAAGRTTQVIGPWYDTNQNGVLDSGESSHPTIYSLPATRYSTYDKANRVIKTKVNTHPWTQYEYDDAGNQTKITDPEGVVTESQYDNNNRLVLSIC